MNAKTQPVNWTPIDYIGLIGFVSFLVATLLWFAIPSSVFLRHTSMTISKSMDGNWWVNSLRETPYGDVTIQWHGQIRVIGRANVEENISCEGASRPVSLIPAVEGNLVRYKIGDWAVPCLEEGPPISITFIRSVILLGFIKLRPTEYTFVVNPDNVPVVITDTE